MTNQALNIWLIEDDFIFQAIFERQLIKINQEIVFSFFSKASLALEKLADNTPSVLPQLIFLDLEMPDIDGFEFLETFATLSITTPISICVITSSIDSKDFKKVMETGLVKHYLIKPVKIAQIEGIIKGA